MKTFKFTFECTVDLSEGEIWPDGDAPKNVSPGDVVSVVSESGGPGRIIMDWGLSEDLVLTITDTDTGDSAVVLTGLCASCESKN